MRVLGVFAVVAVVFGAGGAGAAETLSATEQMALAKAGLFKLRCSSPGVLKCVGFDHESEIPYLKGGKGDQGISMLNVKGPDDPRVKRWNYSVPKLDREIKASGAASLKFTILPKSDAAASGFFVTNISDDPREQIGEGEEIYYQWRQRFDPVMLDGKRDVGRTWKQASIAEGNLYDASGKLTKYLWHCEQLQVVVERLRQFNFPGMHHGCGGKDGQYHGIYTGGHATPWRKQDIDYQPGSGCFFGWLTDEGKKGRTDFEKRDGDNHGCIGYKPNQWMTFQVRVKVGSWYKNDKKYHKNSIVQLWIAEEGQVSKLAINHTRYDLANTLNPTAKYGKVWLLPYHTKQNKKENHPTTYTWYDELVISRQRIPDPLY